MDQQPKIPTLKDSQRPQVKIRGLGVGLTLADRLKQFKKKDLAFILAGLGVLFMAPLAEHFMMAPETSDGTLQPGWAGRGSGSAGSSIFGAGASPYERGDGMAPGGPTGGGSDIITPLNVRDPSALVMGPGAAQQPPTNSALSQTPSPTISSRSDSDLKDALAASARGLGAAAKRAALPVPKISLGGSGLRGLGVAGGGSSASAGLGPISAAGVPNKAAGGDSTGNARATKDYKGVARGQTSGGGGMDALKAAADKQADRMNSLGGAASDLNAAANTAIPSGGGSWGGGGPGSGREDKGFGGNPDRGNKSVGESLDFIQRRERMQKDMELEYKLKEKNNMSLLWADVRNESFKTFVGKGIMEPTAAGFAKCFAAMFGGEACNSAKDNKVWICDGGTEHPEVKEVVGGVDKCTGAEGQYLRRGKDLDSCGVKVIQAPHFAGCEHVTKPDDKSKPGGGSVTNADKPAGMQEALDYSSKVKELKGLEDVKGVCDDIEKQVKDVPVKDVAGAPITKGLKSVTAKYAALKTKMAPAAKVLTDLSGTAPACDSGPLVGPTVIASHGQVISNLKTVSGDLRAIVKSSLKSSTAVDGTRSKVSGARENYNAAGLKLPADPAPLSVTPVQPKIGEAPDTAYTTLEGKAVKAVADVGTLRSVAASAHEDLKAPLVTAEEIVAADGPFVAMLTRNEEFVALNQVIDKAMQDAKKQDQFKGAPLRQLKDDEVDPKTAKSSGAAALREVQGRAKTAMESVKTCIESPESTNCSGFLKDAEKVVAEMHEAGYGVLNSIDLAVEKIEADLKGSAASK